MNALPGRLNPAALALAVLLHLVALGLLLRTEQVTPPPVTVTLSLAAAPSSVVRSGAAPAPRPTRAVRAASLPPVTPPPSFAPRVPPPIVTPPMPPPAVAATAPAPRVLSSAAPEAPPAPPPPALAQALPAAPLATPPPPRAIMATPPPPSLALPLPPPPAPRPPPERAVPRPAPAVPHPFPRREPGPAGQAATRTSTAARSEAASGAAAPSGRVAQSSSWLRAVGAWLEAHKFYPDLARQRGDQGIVIVRFIVARSGQVLEVSVLRGSGSHILDRATEGLLRGAALPPFPATMEGSETTVTFAIRYLLEQ